MRHRVLTQRLPWTALAAVLLAVAGVLVALALRGPAAPVPTTAPQAPVTSSPVELSTPSAAPDEPTREATAAPAPAPPPKQGAVPEPEPGSPGHLSIPSIGVSTDLIRLGLHEDRTVEVPADPDRAGWFDQGPVPGRLGSSVVLGHVDSVDGPAVFDRLHELGPGDAVEVRLRDGSVATFRVDRVATYANEDFPAQEVYAGDPEGRALNLVTCGGEYDAARGGWQSNVVVFTSYVGTA